MINIEDSNVEMSIKTKSLKQIKMKEFMMKSKKKTETETTSNEQRMENNKNILDWNKEDDKSRPATTREMFNMNCHIQEYIHMAKKSQKISK